MKYRLQTKAEQRNVYDFLLTRTYTSLGGVLLLLIAFAALALFFYSIGRERLLMGLSYLPVAGLSLFYMPVFLYIRSGKLLKSLWFYRFLLTYDLLETGIFISCEDREGFVSWEEILKIRQGLTCIMVYTEKGGVFLWRKDDLDEKKEELFAFLRKRLGENKVRIRI